MFCELVVFVKSMVEGCGVLYSWYYGFLMNLLILGVYEFLGEIFFLKIFYFLWGGFSLF